MKKIANYFINNGFIVNLISTAMILMGLISLMHMKRDLAPAWNWKHINISTSLSGAGPTQMEKFVTYPIEQSIKNLQGIKSIDSESGQGYMWISLSLKEDFDDSQELVQKIKDTINNLRANLPKETEEVSVEEIKSVDSFFTQYALVGFDEKNDEHQNWLSKIKLRVGHIKGVSRVNDTARKKQLYIQLKPEEMARYRLTKSQVYTEVINAFTLFPIGTITKGSKDILVEIESKDLQLENIKNIIIKANSSGHKLKLSEIANVQRRLPKRSTREYINGTPSVELNIRKSLDSDAMKLKEEVESFMKKEQEGAPKGVQISVTHDGPSFIARQINALKSNSVFGVILVVLTLFIFLGLKNSLMTTLGIPLAYSFTFFILDTIGISLDLISVAGMLLVIGILVDDAIIVAEQYSQELEEGHPPKEAALKAVMKTWIPITGTVLTTIVAFMPLLIAKNPMTEFMLAIPLVVILALGVSLFESFFILPNHLSHFVREPMNEKRMTFINNLRSIYAKVLEWGLKLRYLVIIFFIGFMGYSVYFASKNIPTDFNLNIQSEKVRFLAVLKKSQSIETTEKIISPIYEDLNKLDKNRYNWLSTRIGRAWINGEKQEGPQYVTFSIYFSQLDDNVEANKKYVEQELKKTLEKYRKSGLYEKLDVSRNFGGHDDAKNNIVEVIISSNAPFEMQEISKKMKETLSPIKGVKSVDLESSKLIDTWVFVPNHSKIFSHGLSLTEVSRQIRGYINKSKIYEYKAGPEILKVYSYIEDGEKQTKTSLENKPIILYNGNSVKTKELGTWEVRSRYNTIKHNDLKRSFIVELPFDDKLITKSDLIKTIKEKMITLEDAYPLLSFKTRDADEQSRENKSSISKSMLYSVLGIFFVLAIILRSIVQPLLICSAIPFGVIGVIWAFYFQDLKLTLMAMIGIIGMAGVVVNDSLILVDTINKMRSSWKSFSKKIIITGATSRLRPIILTSITTLGGVFPMAYGIGGDSGFTKPLAMSMGWGLLFATVLTLLVLPCMLMIQADFMKLFGRIAARFTRVQDDQATSEGQESPKIEDFDIPLIAGTNQENETNQTIQ
ncbi:efflux RND transporter permease subunit [Bacteriovorax sp. DB6_IX]|uniref:efflux RND transporter permease subunit n=1 Tax=Bacteriovorax sp. DB6_IX TaxID=1353530 RepID=UPI00038A1A5C|nr:efflux RND transporter permease subunit [Bacteriovorax sp. DB6_IX]EQC43179.1 export membrane protein [Bacteriovorax sp. DB6_IX]